MKHVGKAKAAGISIILRSLALLLFFLIGGLLAKFLGAFIVGIGAILFGIWVLFAIFAFSFFRDPTPDVPSDPRAIVSPAHGTVDVIDEIEEPEVMQGRCRRISIFLSVFDVHVQNAPISGTIIYIKHTAGQFVNAMRADCSTCNENVLYGIDSTEKSGERIAVRLIAGLIARRIIPWIQLKDVVSKGERTSLIQFGSRVDICLPLNTEISVKLGEKVKGGESILARRPS